MHPGKPHTAAAAYELLNRSPPGCRPPLALPCPAPGKPAADARHEDGMTRADLTEEILDIKGDKGWTWKHICDEIGGHHYANDQVMAGPLFTAVQAFP
jgi:hypothetical protein